MGASLTLSASTAHHLDMPRTAGAAASRFHGNAAGDVAVGAGDDVDGVARRHDVTPVAGFHGAASLAWLCNHCNSATGRDG